LADDSTIVLQLASRPVLPGPSAAVSHALRVESAEVFKVLAVSAPSLVFSEHFSILSR